MDDDGINKNILSVQLLEFKTSLLEAVEELRMGRAVKIQYEEQICKVQMEKQDLAWQNETLSNQAEVLEKQHKEAIAALKKQFQAKVCAMEEEKANFQLGAETKGKEICLLKEELKTLQMSKYNLQKKLQEMEQKSQLHILAKEDHIKQLSEFEKCFAAITCQFGMVKEAHEKLEQNVQEAIQQNQKLRAENKERGAESERLKEELKILSTDLINYKVTCQKRAGEETISLFEKDQQLRELQNKLLMEAEINKKLTEVNQSLKEEKQEVTSSLHHMLELIQRHVQTITNLETQLATLTADYETLERDNELQRAKARENEEKFLALQSEHEKALIMWKKQEESIVTETDTIRRKLESVIEANKHLQEQTFQDMGNSTLMQNQEHKASTVNEVEVEHYDIGCTEYENEASINQVENMTEPDMEYCCSGITIHQMKDKEVLNTEQDTKETLSTDKSADLNRPQHVYKEKDKTRLCEEQKTEFCFHKNKVNIVMTQENVKQSCEEECTEEMPLDTAYFSTNDVLEETDSRYSLDIDAQVIGKSVKMQLDNNKLLAVCSEDPSQQTDSSNDKFGDALSKVVYTVNDKADTTEKDKGVLINGSHKQESTLFPEEKERLMNEHIVDKENSTAGSSIACLSKAGNSYQLNVQNWRPPESNTVTCYDEQNKQYKTEQMPLVEESPTLCADMLQNKQTCRDKQNAVVSFEADKGSKDCTISSNYNTDFKKSFDLSCDISCNTEGITRLGSEPSQDHGYAMIPVLISPLDCIKQLHKSAYLKVAPDHLPDSQNFQEIGIDKNGRTDSAAIINQKNTYPSDSGDVHLSRSNLSDLNKTESFVNIQNSSQMITQASEPINVDKGSVQKESIKPDYCTPQENKTETSLGDSCEKLAKLPSVVCISDSVASKSETLLVKETTELCSSPAELNCLQNDAQPVKLLHDKPSCSVKEKYISKNERILPSVLHQNASVNKEQGPLNIRQVADDLTTHVHSVPKRDHSAEWNAIAQIFQDSSFPTEHSSKVMEKTNITLMSNPSPCPHSASSTGHQDLSYQALEKQTTIVPELPFGEDNNNIPCYNIQEKISEIEMFLVNQRLWGPKKRKLENSMQSAAEE